MRLLLTGGAGYIGSHTALELLRHGHDIIIADDFSNSSPDSVKAIEKETGRNVKLYACDVSDRRKCETIFKENKLDVILLGRRRADGNYVGRGSNSYLNSNGILRYSPLADWTHEEVLAYIHYNRLEMPPIYEWEKGYLCGTHPWPARQYMKDAEQGWREVYEIDRSIVENAAEFFPSAKAFLFAMK